ncbi:aminotransferase class I/II-fold pyridoxal phosphate-dependent enzyme [Peptostreptococcus equinus]|uniref:Aminotransferase class I/II-fold pyridoxal phosphate-dependent enzyme n=1 Tax=Peptostreptococcus equinus TaxID=3003601 RepID=A0ABY7JRR8_9FIRM|nr:aminotransferase class I/II-fold pyridoxal phosphate-dependent enzyme [Peptostreptococcus sp. CBA3647]WAW15830.1 aminotransferase class I/II-fold pyridoxal phosphate-dependent enzyme [Peptostreptococcus sp. CBA3647]
MYTNQKRRPIVEALEKYKKERIVSFDVPGHKQGKGHKALTDFFGSDAVSVDYNSSKPLDNLTHPTGVIKDAEELAAQAFGAKSAFFMIGGTTSSVQAMILSSTKRNDKIIMPRNVHKSAINALVINGAIPIYINPGVDKELGISLGMSVEDIKSAIEKHPDAKAILVNNPTYYGICSDLKRIVKIAHEAGMLVLVDEAHGTHFYFNEKLPISAMKAGADMAAVSVHKTGGALTQSSFLLLGEGADSAYTRQIINLSQTTSGSYLLMASLDIARSNLALNGKEIFERVIKMTDYAREEINLIGGYRAFGKEIINGDTVYDFDTTKLSIHTRDLGLAGIEVYDILRDEYDIQIEFGDIGNILAIVSVGDRELELERLIGSLSEIKRLKSGSKIGIPDHEYIDPIVKLSPQEAFYSESEVIAIKNSVGRISTEFVMAYPPGIPILAPGEKISREIVDYIIFAKAKGCKMTGTKDMQMNDIYVVKEK